MNKVVKNASWIIGIRIVQSLLSFIIGSITARYLGPANYGVIGYAQSIVAFVTPVVQLGLTAILVQEIICHPADEGKILGTAQVMSAVSAIFCIIGVISFAILANAGENETIIICALYSVVLLCQSFELIQYWFQAKYLSKYASIVMLIAYLVVSGYKIFLLATQKSVYWFALSFVIDYFLIAIGLHIMYHNLGGQKFKFSLDFAKKLFSEGKYYIISGLMVTIFAQTDRIMLKLMIDETSIGYYAAAATCASLASFFFSALIDSMRPMVVESKATSAEKYENNIVQLYSVVIYCALLFSFVVFLFAPWIVKIIYGEDYLPTVSVLRVLVWYTSFSYFGCAKDVWILVEGKQKYLFTLNMAGAIANVTLNYFFIPIWGATGAAFASLLTQIFTNLIMSFIIKELRPNAFLFLKSLNPKGIWQMVKNIRVKND